jgi:outer membrane protein assembly factor BamB/predicted MPP superfamily phosphohydrolase
MHKNNWTRSLYTFLTALVILFVTNISTAQDFRFAFLSDTHIGVKNADEDLVRAVQDINADTSLKFVVISGDITEQGTDQELQIAAQILSGLNKPLYVLTGNHDGNWSPSGGKSFRTLLGAGRFSFNYNGYLFIGTNSGPNMLHKSPGQVPREDIHWMDEILNQSKNKGLPVVYVNHYPQDSSQRNWYEAIDRLKQHNVQLVLVGHGHLNGSYDFEGIPGMMGRSSLRDVDSIGGYNIVSFRLGMVVFEEKKSLLNKLHQWAVAPLFNHHFSTDTTKYARPSYVVNDQYPNIKREWQYQDNFDLGTGAVLISDLIIATNTGGEIFALDKETGKKKWSYTTREKIYSTPIFTGHYLIVASTDGWIYCLNPANGNLWWKVNTGSPIVAKPLVEKDVIYIGSSNGHFTSRNVNTGKTIWDFTKVKDFIRSKPLLYNNRLYFGSWGGEFYVLNAKSGSLEWKWKDSSGNRMLAPGGCVPVAVNNKVFIVSPDQFMTAFDAITGTIIWRKKMAGIKVRESIGLSKDSTQLFVKTTEGKLFSIATTAPDMKINWSTNLLIGYDLCDAPIIESDNIIYVPSNSGVVAAVSNIGKLLWKHKVSNSLINSITPVGKDRIVISSVDGKITCLKF